MKSRGKSGSTAATLNRPAESRPTPESLYCERHFDKLIAAISVKFIDTDPEKIDECIVSALGSMGKFLRADRSYLFKFSSDKKAMEITHEWLSPGIRPQLREPRDVPVSVYGWLTGKILHYKTVYVPKLAALPAEAAAEKNIFQSGSIKTLVNIPLVYGGDVVGIFGFDAVREEREWSPEIIKLLRIVGLLFSGITERKREQEQLRETNEKLRKTIEGVVKAITKIVETRDPYTAGHEQRVSELACAIAEEMRLPADKINGVRMASAIHDIGKIYVPAEILSKPGKLSDIEFGIIKTHSAASYEILKVIDFPWPVAQIAFQHQERFDGSGYPLGISGEDILVEARILAVADVVEAMSFNRPYRPMVGVDQALEEIEGKSGTLFDPVVARACLRLFKEKRFAFRT